MQQVEWLIRPAADFEWKYALSIIPEIISSSCLPSVLFVATPKNQPELIVACGACLPLIRDTVRPGFPFFVRVHSSYRRKGIGRLIIAQLADYVRSWNVPYLLSYQAYTNGNESDFLKACGFASYLKVHKFQVSRKSAHILLDLLEKVQQKYHSLSSLQLLPFVDSKIHEIAPLYCAHFMVSYQVGVQKLSQLASLPQATLLSSIAYLDSEPVGFVIGYLDQDNVPKVDFWMIAHESRNSAISLVLLCHFVKSAYDHGYHIARFDGNDNARSTLKIASRLNAETIEVCESFAYDLET